MFNFCPKINFDENLQNINLNFGTKIRNFKKGKIFWILRLNPDFDFQNSAKIAKIQIFIKFNLWT